MLCLLMEAALQAHLTHAGLEAAESCAGPPLELVSAPLAVLGAALASRPALTVQGMIAQSVALEAPLTLRLLFSLQRTLADGDRRPTSWMP